MPNSDQDPLEAIREEIDAVDAELIRLLNRRAELAKAVGRLKDRDGKPFFTPEREREIFDQLKKENPGPLLDRQFEGIYREIISASRAAARPLAVAFWGPVGTYTHMAALQTFGSSCNLESQDSI